MWIPRSLLTTKVRPGKRDTCNLHLWTNSRTLRSTVNLISSISLAFAHVSEKYYPGRHSTSTRRAFLLEIIYFVFIPASGCQRQRSFIVRRPFFQRPLATEILFEKNMMLLQKQNPILHRARINNCHGRASGGRRIDREPARCTRCIWTRCTPDAPALGNNKLLCASCVPLAPRFSRDG